MNLCPICKKEMVKHIIKEGARYRVHSWDGNGEHCSTKDCENNHGWGKCKKGGVNHDNAD